MRKSLIEELSFQPNRPFIGAEITIKAMLKGYRIGEVGVQTSPREFGRGASTSMPNIVATIRDMLHVHQTIFSADYDLPPNRHGR